MLYQYPVDRLVQAFKFQRRLACGQVLADELAQAIQVSHSCRPNLIAPVPLHLLRRFRRGFNQAEFLALELGKRLHLPVWIDHLKRIRSTAAQSGLDRNHRQNNLKGAFHCRDSRGLKIALVDDVLTTGATLGECSRLLKAAGAAHISVWVAARVPATPP